MLGIACLTPFRTNRRTTDVRATNNSHRLVALIVAGLVVGFTQSPAFAKEKPDTVTAKSTADAQTDVPLIPRNVLFGNPDKAAARISPDGKHLSFLAPVDGVLNVWVGPVDDPDAAKPVTDDKKRGIRSYFWAFTNRHILYLQDVGGDEDWHVYSVDLDTGKTIDLTPLEGVAAQIEEVSHKFPDEILVGLNDRNPQFHDIYRVNIGTGKRELVQQNDEFLGFLTDDDYRVRFATKFTPDGGNEIMQPDGKGGWTTFEKIPMQDTLTTSPVGFDKTGEKLFLIDSRGRDTGALTSVDLDTLEQTVLAEDPLADIGGAMLKPVEKTLQAVNFTYARTRWIFFDPEVEEDFAFLQTLADGDVQIVSRTLDDNQWIVAFLMDDGPVRYYRFDRPSNQATFLFTNRSDLEGVPLAKMHPEVIEARDGLKLVSYLTLPRGTDPDGDGRPNKPLPMVLNVHGGPWARDDWGLDPEHQLWANRGYAVLSVNYRGSTGFGKKFVNSGNKEWAGKMHEDLIDAVRWAVDQGIAQADKVAIYGGSYGGYATLVGLTMTPDFFACGVDIVGPSNIETLLNTIPPYWAPAIQMFKDRVGDHTTEEGRAFLHERSPLNFVDRIERPLLIGQGKNDPRVKQSEADQIVDAMKEKRIPVTYVLYPDEGHGFARPENRMSFYAVAEPFLAENLGGRYEPVGDAFAGSSVTVPTGAEYVPGVEAALEEIPHEEVK
ncbi:MAG: S9 family peptidase [Pirellulales bacterium]|nr:S9 family peptidase [Planctomycetales bacterium]